jgi:seryl-tRNA synthetase
MLDLKLLKNDIDSVIDSLATRDFDTTFLTKVSLLISTRNQNINILSQLQSSKNSISKEISVSKDKESLLEKANELKEEIFLMEDKVKEQQKELDALLPLIPNIPLGNVPIGKDENDNVVIKEYPTIGRGLVKAMKPHYEIGVEKDIIDFERAVKMSGTRFVIFKNEGARLIRALSSFMLDTHALHGYVEMHVPLMVNSNTMYGTGQLPKFANDLFKIANSDL